MQKFEAIQKLSPSEFKRLTGVRKETFRARARAGARAGGEKGKGELLTSPL